MWKGKLLFKQYIALERAILGIKMFSLCETTGFLWNSYVYLGKVTKAAATVMEMLRRLGKSGAVSSRLMEGLLGKATISKNSMWTIGTLLRNFFSFFYENEIASCGAKAKVTLQCKRQML